jgi:hypothetical protein
VWIASIAMGLVAAMLNFAIALPTSGVERRSRLAYESA